MAIATEAKRQKIYRLVAGKGVYITLDAAVKSNGRRVNGKCEFASDGVVEVALITVAPARDNSRAELIREAKTVCHELQHARAHSEHAKFISEWAGGTERDRWAAERLMLKDEGEAERAEEKLFDELRECFYWLAPHKEFAR